MRILRRIALLSALALPLVLSACENSVASEEELVGAWRREEEPGPGNTEEYLNFYAEGTFIREVRFYGQHGLPATDLTGYSQVESEYRLNGDRLETRPIRQTEWDSSRGQPVTLPLTGDWQDAGTVSLFGETMIWTYTTYPADAPVETRAVYRRVPRPGDGPQPA